MATQVMAMGDCSSLSLLLQPFGSVHLRDERLQVPDLDPDLFAFAPLTINCPGAKQMSGAGARARHAGMPAFPRSMHFMHRSSGARIAIQHAKGRHENASQLI